MVTQVLSEDITEQERKTAVAVERLICVDPKFKGSSESNKYWNGIVLSNGDFFAEWGKVGVTRQFQRTPANKIDAHKKLEQEVYKRLNYKPPKKVPYRRQQTIATDGTTKVSQGSLDKSTLKATAVKEIAKDPEVRKLVEWLTDVNVHAITSNTKITFNTKNNTFETPLGLVTPSGISQARSLLGNIANFVSNRQNNNDRCIEAISDYCMIVPQNVGMGSVRSLFANLSDVQRQNQILDALDAALLDTTTKDNKQQQNTKMFDVELTPITSDSAIRRIDNMFNKTKQSMHKDVYGCKLQKVYSVKIGTMTSAFENDGKTVGNITELFHGTKCSNLLSILKIGMIISPASSAHVTGRLFGNGLYFSDQSTKSLNYATNFWNRGGKTDRIFMFLVDVAMGKSHVPSGNSGWQYNLPKGYDSCFAKAGISGVINNEMVVYNTWQANPTFLIEFSK